MSSGSPLKKKKKSLLKKYPEWAKSLPKQINIQLFYGIKTVLVTALPEIAFISYCPVND